MSEINEMRELIDSFIAYRNVLAPLQESLKGLADTYDAIRTDLDNLNKNGGTAAELSRINQALSSQARSGQELSRHIEEYSAAGEKYTQAVGELTKRFNEVTARISAVEEIEKNAEGMLERLDSIISEKRASYNLKELQKSLDNYNKNVEKISDFINKDIGAVLQQNAEKIEAIKKENEELATVVGEQGKSVATLSATFEETNALLRRVVEKDGVNEEYLFDALDRWAADRKIKIKKK